MISWPERWRMPSFHGHDPGNLGPSAWMRSTRSLPSVSRGGRLAVRLEVLPDPLEDPRTTRLSACSIPASERSPKAWRCRAAAPGRSGRTFTALVERGALRDRRGPVRTGGSAALRSVPQNVRRRRVPICSAEGGQGPSGPRARACSAANGGDTVLGSLKGWRGKGTRRYCPPPAAVVQM